MHADHAADRTRDVVDLKARAGMQQELGLRRLCCAERGDQLDRRDRRFVGIAFGLQSRA